MWPAVPTMIERMRMDVGYRVPGVGSQVSAGGSQPSPVGSGLVLCRPGLGETSALEGLLFQPGPLLSAKLSSLGSFSFLVLLFFNGWVCKRTIKVDFTRPPVPETRHL